jgi:hypothetical protein
MMPKAFIIHPADNVATAIDTLEPGKVELVGGGRKGDTIRVQEPIKFGFKIALKDMNPGEPVIKNNAAIGKVKVAVKSGSMMHLHNISSDFDERSGTFDNETGAPTEEDVYV